MTTEQLKFEAMREAAILHLQRKEIEPRLIEHGRTNSIKIDESYLAGKQFMIYRMIRHFLPEETIVELLSKEACEAFCELYGHNRNDIEGSSLEQYEQLVKAAAHPKFGYYVCY